MFDNNVPSIILPCNIKGMDIFVSWKPQKDRQIISTELKQESRSRWELKQAKATMKLGSFSSSQGSQGLHLSRHSESILCEASRVGMDGKGMHLPPDRWWGIWFDWCRQQTQQRSEPCGNRSWEAYAIPSDWRGSHCQERARIQLSKCHHRHYSGMYLKAKSNWYLVSQVAWPSL